VPTSKPEPGTWPRCRRLFRVRGRPPGPQSRTHRPRNGWKPPVKPPGTPGCAPSCSRNGRPRRYPPKRWS
jgi:hypothetical protein